MLRPDVVETHFIIAAVGDAARPCLELLPRPLESVVPVPEFPSGQPLEQCVVLRVGRGDERRAGFRRAEHHLFERIEPRRVDVLDHLHSDSSVKTGKSFIPVGKGTVQQVNAFPLLVGHGIQMQTLAGRFQRPVRDVDTRD